MRIDNKRNNMRKRAVSLKMFVEEYGEQFPEKVKERLMDLESRCFLTRKEVLNRFDLKHVEHLQYECDSKEGSSSSPSTKEYSYGQFVVIDGNLYFSENCLEGNEVMQAPIVNSIFDSLDSEGMISDESNSLKKLDDDNIDFVIENILSICPDVSQAYTKIMKGIIARTK